VNCDGSITSAGTRFARVETADEIAKAVVFLPSDNASYVSGTARSSTAGIA
jgi:hypothetical protein